MQPRRARTDAHRKVGCQPQDKVVVHGQLEWHIQAGGIQCDLLKGRCLVQVQAKRNDS